MNTLYLDMDGVVADWRSNATRVIGYDCLDPKQHYPAEDWAKIKLDPHLFLHLDLMPRAQELVAQARLYRDILGWNLLFLTAIPHNNDVPWTFHDKFTWGQLYFPDIPIHFGPYSEDKARHCRPGDILVDDREDNCSAWRMAAGVAYKAELALDSVIESLKIDYEHRLWDRAEALAYMGGVI